MAEVFVDTAGWAAFLIGSDADHGAADALVRRWQVDGTRAVTTNYVLAELVALLGSRSRSPRAHQLEAVDAIRAADWVTVVHVDQMLDAEAWDLLRSRSDKAWSLVDCASFVVMRDRGLSEALTTDHHFEQAGYSLLLK